MITVFTDGFPGEALYSIGGRYHDLFHFPNKYTAILHFCGSRRKFAIDLPCHIDALIQALPTHQTYTADHFIEYHTQFRLYKPFLPIERVNALKAAMRGNGQNSPHVVAGVLSCRVSTIQNFKYCLKCVEEDRSQYGECYFHTSQHAPGVKVCHKHQCWLVESNQIAQGLQEFISAETIIRDKDEDVNSLDLMDQRQCDLFAIAKNINWLLEADLQPNDIESLRSRYQCILVEQGYASATGHVKSQKLITDFKHRFEPAFLAELSCELEGYHERNWLARIVQSNQVQHPIRHILLLIFLGYTPEQFFNLSIENAPFGYPPWLCLNPVCSYYQQPAIIEFRLGFSRKLKRRPLGTFSCPHCGFTFSRTGPDKTDEDRFKSGQIISYGSIWDDLLQKLWNNPSVRMKEIANDLGVGQDTINRQAKRLQLPPRSLLSTGQGALPLNQTRNNLLDRLESSRKSWLTALEQYPEVRITELQQRFSELYSFLYRFDSAWLSQHKPSRKSGSHLDLVNWKERDAWLLGQLPRTIENIKKSQPLRRITLNAVAKGVGWGEGSIQRDLNKLPKAAEALSSIVETHEDFALRRIQSSLTYFLQLRTCPSSSVFKKHCSLNPEVQTDRTLKAVEDALTLLEQIIKDK